MRHDDGLFNAGVAVMRHLSAVLRASLLAVLAWAALLALPGRAAVSVEDSQALQGTVQAQLAAFAGDDAEGAFSYAAPNIRSLFQTPENFMSMVRQAYPVVYRPKDVQFLTPRSLEAAVVQPVYMRDSDGKSWLAMYTLQRQADGRWLISGCVLAPNRSVGA